MPSPTFNRTAEFLPTLGGHINFVKAYMAPIMHNWLLERVDGPLPPPTFTYILVIVN